MDFMNGIVALGSMTRSLPKLNQAAIKGEPGTGFEARGQKGAFQCGNCEYFSDTENACDQYDMKENSKQPRLSDGRVSVKYDDCCEYIDRKSSN